MQMKLVCETRGTRKCSQRRACIPILRVRISQKYNEEQINNLRGHSTVQFEDKVAASIYPASLLSVAKIAPRETEKIVNGNWIYARSRQI